MLRAGRRSPGDLDQLVHDLLKDLTDDVEAWAGLTRRFRGDIFFGLFMKAYNEGVSLSPRSLLAGGRRGLAFDLDMYGDSVHEG